MKEDCRLSWAIIPTAGRGTRLRPATNVIPKVLLPVGLRPMIDWAIDEALEADVEEIAFVVSPDQPMVKAHIKARQSSSDWPVGVEAHFVEQPNPAGLGDALIRCRPWTGDDSFGVVVPDNWFDSSRAPVAQLAGAHFRTGEASLGLIEVRPGQGFLLGNVGEVELEAMKNQDFRIMRLGDKSEGAFVNLQSRSVLRGCARYVLGPGFYDALEATGPFPEGEWDDVPAFQYLADKGALIGHKLDGHHFDLGHQNGYLAAMNYLFERDVIGNGA